jgi:hypothetical protein
MLARRPLALEEGNRFALPLVGIPLAVSAPVEGDGEAPALDRSVQANGDLTEDPVSRPIGSVPLAEADLEITARR